MACNKYWVYGLSHGTNNSHLLMTSGPTVTVIKIMMLKSRHKKHLDKQNAYQKGSNVILKEF